MNARIGRINEEISKEICGILRTVKDPRVAGAFVTVTNVDTSGDLKYSKIYYSVVGQRDPELAKGIKSANGYIRRELARRLNLRVTPELRFIEDDSMNKGAHISSLIKDVAKNASENNCKTENTDE